MLITMVLVCPEINQFESNDHQEIIGGDFEQSGCRYKKRGTGKRRKKINKGHRYLH
jgi:hypothetical protein